LKVWFDQESLLPGQDWEAEIKKAVQGADFVALLLSKNSASKRGFFQKEMRISLSVAETIPCGHIHLLPIRLDECQVPTQLKSFHYVDFFPNWELGLGKLIKAIELEIGAPLGHDHRLGHSNLQENQFAKVDSDAKEGVGRNDDQGPPLSSRIEQNVVDGNRRLPIYFLIDCSRSMEGESASAVEQGLSSLITDLKSDPQALETAYVSFIFFANGAWQVMPLTELLLCPSSYKLFTHVTEETSLGAALLVLDIAIDREVIPRTEQHLGDYCPLTFILIGSPPTDDWVPAANRLMNRRDRKVNILLLGAGPSVDEITSAVPGIIGVKLSDAVPGELKAFFKWVDQEDK